MFRIKADTASYTCCFGLTVQYHKLLQKEKVSNSPLVYCFWIFIWTYKKIQQSVNHLENTKIMQEVKKKNDQNVVVSSLRLQVSWILWKWLEWLIFILQFFVQVFMLIFAF